MRRQIKKSTIVTQNKQKSISYIQQPQRNRSRSRSRDKNKQQKIKQAQIEEVNANKRRQLLKRMRERQEDEGEFMNFNNQPKQQNNTSLNVNVPKVQDKLNQIKDNNQQIRNQQFINRSIPDSKPKLNQNQNQNSQNQSQQQQQIILHKPVYVSKEQRQTLRNQSLAQQKLVQQQSRKMKIQRSNAKLLLNETLKTELEEEDDIQGEDSDKIQMPDDDDTKDQGLEYELWKIRELKRIKRDNQERNALAIKQADIQRRRRMTDQERLIENKKLGSDLTDKTQTTKYVYMQKYYHRGAFFQDSQDAVMKKDYNLPTAMQLQDKTMLPKILQKRKNDFGKKGQSKHTHLNDIDTTNFDPRTKANESVMISLQKKMAGYKDSFLQGKR